MPFPFHLSQPGGQENEEWGGQMGGAHRHKREEGKQNSNKKTTVHQNVPCPLHSEGERWTTTRGFGRGEEVTSMGRVGPTHTYPGSGGLNGGGLGGPKKCDQNHFKNPLFGRCPPPLGGRVSGDAPNTYPARPGGGGGDKKPGPIWCANS